MGSLSDDLDRFLKTYGIRIYNESRTPEEKANRSNPRPGNPHQRKEPERKQNRHLTKHQH